MSQAPFWALLPSGMEPLPRDILVTLESFGVRLVDFEVDPSMVSFPFAHKVLAAAATEGASGASRLIWMDSGALILQPLHDLLIDEPFRLACRPVDLTLIGSPFDQPTDPFWKRIYNACGVPDEHLFPLCTAVDQNVIRPYFNAGLLVVRPESGLLQAWQQDFLRLVQDAAFEQFYQANPRYRLFMHQAVMAGTLLSRLVPKQIHELPPTVNYPLHFHHRYPAQLRPAVLEDVITCRYENIFELTNWQEKIPPASPLLRGWLKENIFQLIPSASQPTSLG